MSGKENDVRADWTGRFYEDLAVGDVYRSRWGHTVTEADNALFTHLTHNTNPLHFDARYAAGSRWGRILVNSTFTLALVTGMSTTDVSQNAMANLGWEKVRLPNPVFIGDTIYCQSEVLAKRVSKSHPEGGIVTVRSLGVNQDGKVVIDLTRQVMVYRRGHSPQPGEFPAIQ
jgi:acyl dehydratase